MHQNKNKINRKIFTEQEIAYLKQNYLLGSKTCANTLNRSVKSIQYKCFSLGLKSTPESRKKPRYKNPDKYAVNPTNFISPTTPEACYILGLLWADGTINTSTSNMRSIILSTTFPDSTTFYNIFLKTGNWKFYKKQYNKNWKPSVTIHTNNRILADYLVTHNYKTKSQSACSILSTVPDNLKQFWFRGFFDGDGCFTVNKNLSPRVVLAGPYEQDWRFIKEMFEKLDIKFLPKQKTSKKGHRSSHINICSKTDVKKFFDYIYDSKDPLFGLKRKYDKYIEYKKLKGIS